MKLYSAKLLYCTQYTSLAVHHRLTYGCLVAAVENRRGSGPLHIALDTFYGNVVGDYSFESIAAHYEKRLLIGDYKTYDAGVIGLIAAHDHYDERSKFELLVIAKRWLADNATGCDVHGI